VQLFSNNSKGTVGTALTNVATSLVLTTGHGARFPTIAGGDFALATLSDGTNIEVVKVTAHVASSDTFTIARAQEAIANTAAAAWAFGVGAKFEMRLTDGSFSAMVDSPFAVQNADVPFPTGRAGMFARSWAGRGLPSWDPGTGNPTKLQTNIYSNQAVLLKPGTGAVALTAIGAGLTAGGTLSHPALAATNFMTKQRRAQYANVVTTTNQFLGVRATDLQCFRGAAANEGGFHFFCRFAFPLFPAGTRVFIGLASLLTGVNVTADPSAAAESHIGIAMDAADTNLTLMTKDGTTNTKTAIGAGLARIANETYDLHIFAKQNSANIGVRLDRVPSGGGASANLLDTTISTTIPAAATFLAPQAAMSNGTANTTVASVLLALMSLYLETDW
jgi:hypothetical protein